MNPRQDVAYLIPAYNEAQVLPGTLEALFSSGVARSDIYVVDDCSKDTTAEIARQCGVNVYRSPKNGGKAAAQTAGLRYFKLTSRYDWVVFLDGDSKVDKSFASELRKVLANTDNQTDLVTGQVCSVKNSHIFSASRAYEYAFGQAFFKKAQNKAGVIFVSPGCASVYRTRFLGAHLRMDTSTLAEDMDLTIRVHRSGGNVKYAAELMVWTQDPSNLKDYLKQITRWYRGFWQVMRKHVFTRGVRKQRVDFYLLFLIADSLLFNRSLWIGAMFFLDPSLAAKLMSFDAILNWSIATVVAFRIKRWDVFWKFPAYYWLSWLNVYAYLRSFIEVIVLQKKQMSWNKVARYQFHTCQPPVENLK